MKSLQTIATALADKKAEEIRILDVRGLSPVTDYLIITSVETIRQAQAAADEIELKEGRPFHKEGYENGEWIALDYGDCMVHIFHRSKRPFYGLDELWSRAVLVDVK